MTGLFGGMGGCAVVGQSVMNVKVSGALFFASSNDLLYRFDYAGAPAPAAVVPDLSGAQVWDAPPSRHSMRSARRTRPRAPSCA